jgi:hypothetical protein
MTSISLSTLPRVIWHSLLKAKHKPPVDMIQNMSSHSRWYSMAIDLNHQSFFQREFMVHNSVFMLSYLYLLAQRAQLAAMLDTDFIYSIPGLIHTGNELKMDAKPVLNKNIEQRVGIKIEGKEQGRLRRIFFEVEMVQDGCQIAHNRSTYVLNNINKLSTKKIIIKTPKSELANAVMSEAWPLAENIGRQYAKLSGDFNPIHLHSIVSRWYGFPRPIVQGMYLVARAEASIVRQMQRPLHTISVKFRSPVSLPSRPCFHLIPEIADRGKFYVTSARDFSFHIDGRYECS